MGFLSLNLLNVLLVKKNQKKRFRVNGRSIFEKVLAVSMMDMFLLGYFTSGTGFIRSDVDVYWVFVGLVFMDFLLIIMWKHLKEYSNVH